ncbi:MAG: hypothetical protein BWZ11_00164 [Bacteroidetes bacterium ADurb.BinA395]|nr:MAG: hypothetical protein BWZ11_00164 [Bacteroidetes bacterium ADurb.BinA395]
MLINLSNHPYELWSVKQQEAAAVYGSCVDLPFPAVDPEGDETYIEQLAESYAAQVLAIAKGKEETTVHLMGEMTFTFTLLQMLLKENITCIASTSERISVDLGSGQKETRFDFVRFRKYINL